uniref:uncharacterized protein At4g38062 n=1 Tax=Erigeron canadensis TaxID=72917 RepID=UPI001CB9239B|nr:uncharacterized protein At4g38062 [Erigeron canadensis]
MEKVYEELDDAKAEIEKLRLECRAKAELFDNFKRSHADQVKRIQELNQKLEKQAQEVEAKADEVFDTKQSLEELECRLKEKESVVKSLTSNNDKLRADFDSKLRESEVEKQKLLSSLEEANVKMSDLEHQNRVFMDKIEVLKEGIVSVSQKKCVTESKMAMASKQMRERGDIFGKLEEEKVKLEEQLKWKNEQFQHLEEAHKKLRDNLKAKEKEWDMEKCALVDHISAMETKLGSQSKVSEVFKRRLETCSEALACEENRRKGLDIQILELEETKSKLVALTNEKESACKEMESKIVKLGDENQELVSSLKESQIREASNSSSITKLQNNIKSLEQNHNVKEAEWSSQFEKVAADLDSCKLELASKEARLKDIMTELNAYNSQVLQFRAEIKSLEQNHNVKEAEWSSRFEKVAADLNSCRLELASKEARLKDIMTESDAYNSQVLQLRTEIKSLEQIHNAGEADWSSRFEKVAADLNSCRLELASKEARLKDVMTESDAYNSQVLQLRTEIKSLEQIHNAREADWSSQLDKLVEDLNSCRFALESKDARLKEIITESNDYKSQVSQLTMEIKSLEQIHKAREAEWNSRFEKVVEDLNSCRPELESKEARLKEIMAELNDCHSQVSQLSMEKQEAAHMMEAVKSKVAADLNSFRLELESKDARLKEIMMELNDCNSQVLQLTKEKEESALKMKAMKSAADAELDSCRLELQSKEARLKAVTTELNDYNSQVLQLIKEKEESAVMMVAMKSTLVEARSDIDKEKLVLHKEIESHKKKLLQTESELVYVCDLLESKEARLKEITSKLNDCNTQVLQLTMEKEESAIMMVAMKSTLTEARSNIDKEKVLLHKEAKNRKKKLLQTESELVYVCDLLESKEARLKEITTELNDCNSQVLQLIMEKEESAIMMVAMKSTLMEAGSNIDEDKILLHKELDNHKKQLLQTTTKLENACDLLDKANEELAHSYCEVNGVEFELQIWKSVAEKLEVHLEASRQMRRDVEASLLAQVATEVKLKEENSSLVCTLKEKEKTITDLEEKIKEVRQNTLLQLAKKNGDDLEKWEKDWVTQELEAAILAQLEYERIHEYEKQSLNKLVEEKDQRIVNLQEIMSSLEKELDHSSASFSSQLTRMQAEMNFFHEAWQKIRTTVVLKEIEVQEKSLMIIELEKDLGEQIEFVKKCLLSVKNLSSDNENLMDIIGGASEWINKLSREDGQVMGNLRNIMSRFDENHVSRGGHGHPDSKDHFDPVKENINLYQSPKRNTVDISLDERSPLRTLNS